MKPPPPEKSGGQSSEPGNSRDERTAATRHPKLRGYGRELLAQLHRRHEAAKRLPPLAHSRRRDPLTARERADCWERP